jgi:hypothetical protein
MITSLFRNRANFERTVITRQYGYNNTANNPQNIGGGGFAGSQGPSTVQIVSNYSPNIPRRFFFGRRPFDRRP